MVVLEMSIFPRVPTIKIAMKMQKAITVIQFKLEGQLIAKHPEYKMDNRRLLDKIDIKKGTVLLDGKEYEILDKNFPTINFDNPYELTKEEQSVIAKLRNSFINCGKLKKTIIPKEEQSWKQRN